VDTESHMKHMVTELEGKNEPINFAHTVLGNYFLETDHGCYEAQTSEIHPDLQSKLLPQTHNSACTILTNLGFSTTNKTKITNMWSMFFDGSRSQEGVGQDVC
jgi:hypothetical protein